MAEIAFHRNYGDLSDADGFQFEFSCEECGNGWRTEYQRFLPGTATGVLDTAGSLLGGFFGSASRISSQIRDQQYRTARDQAFAQAIEQAKVHFSRCRQCNRYVCAECWNGNLNLCTSCAPSVESAADVAARGAELDLARTRAQNEVVSGKRATDENVVCPNCSARVPAAKFCAECGQPLAMKRQCLKCNADIAPGTKFCPECGAKQI